MMARRNNIHHLDNDFTRQQNNLNAQQASKMLLKQRRKRRAIIIISFFGILALISTVQIIRAQANLAHVKTQITAQKQKITKKKATQKNLNTKIKQLNDKDYCEKIIRDKYYYSKPGETVYSFPSEVANDVSSSK
ncbi:hypothetical protein FC56_GL001037 [Lentilactobacillus senioris DSM 24302 = JCM 17472]|uniref:Septum formation initiator n=1 Tax=Lentilactobacillus senioris DSM 24302 = JCM 17472 TaxID=1423802 RepID=A0A0R2CTN4_9LACO|nr:septum formation initiator family protein [Lentilactobacillus senioris]KRM94736.1 hypothetical protein FC56_GL001037 [Lentilactobacillus senioris DSM 24302 = JCM 17472]